MTKFLPPLILLLATLACNSTTYAQDSKGNAAAGAKKNALCIGCHGIKGYHIGFPQVHKVPKISGQSAGYILAALHAYKDGSRKHPSMRSIASSLNEQDMTDLAAYYEDDGFATTLPASLSQGSDKASELLAKGACTSCHGANLSKPIAPDYPRIAGQHSDYLYVALRSYKTNDKPMIGRAHPIMGGITQAFSNAELKVLADYVGSLPGELQTVQHSRYK